MWPIYILDGHGEDIREALKTGFSDPHDDTRWWTRKAYWAFVVHFHQEAETLISSLQETKKQNQDSESSTFFT